MFKYGGIVLLPALILLTGCPPPRAPGIAPRDEQQAVGRVNDNLSQIRQPVQYKGFASFRFRDSDGKQRSFLAQEATVFFSQPHNLRFDIRSLAGTIAEFGSNAERYWLWVEPEVKKLWWGSWANLGQQTERLPLPPNDLIDSLMLRPLPATQANGSPPTLRRSGTDYYLIYERIGPGQQFAGTREIHLDPYPPYQPIEIIDRSPENRVQMRSVLANYARIAGDGPYAPRRYAIYWPLDEAEMKLDVTRAVFRPELPPETFAFPASWQGEVEELDTTHQ